MKTNTVYIFIILFFTSLFIATLLFSKPYSKDNFTYCNQPNIEDNSALDPNNVCICYDNNKICANREQKRKEYLEGNNEYQTFKKPPYWKIPRSTGGVAL